MSASKRFSVRNLILTSLFICLGVLIPYITGHAAGIPGNILLPMHLPVLLCGFICGWQYGAVCGLITPLVSSLLTAMPPLWPMLPIMACELLIYGVISGLTYRKFKWNIYASLITAMAAGRVVYGLIFALLTTVSTQPIKAAGVGAAIITGIPGILIQLVFIPILVKAVEQNQKSSLHLKTNSALAQAKQEIQSREYSCVIIKDNAIIHRADGRGVKPLRDLYESAEGREILQDAFVVDKIIGKAAAIICVLGQVKEVYGEVMSQSAHDYLKAHNIPCSYGRCVDMINNRTGNGICPIEQSVLYIDDPEEGYQKLTSTIQSLMSQASSQ